jgi:hypothetical protein
MMLDATDLLLFQHQTAATGISGLYKDSLFADGCGAPWSTEICGPMPETDDEYAAYCSGAQFSTYAIGSNLNIQSQGATVQAGIDAPDSLAAQALITGNGKGTISFSSINMAGIGNTSALGYQNSVKQSIRADGNPFSVSAGFQWSSFAGLWQDEPAEEEA